MENLEFDYLNNFELNNLAHSGTESFFLDSPFTLDKSGQEYSISLLNFVDEDILNFFQVPLDNLTPQLEESALYFIESDVSTVVTADSLLGEVSVVNEEAIESFLTADYTDLHIPLSQAIVEVKNSLSEFLQQPEHLQKLRTAFGEKWQSQTAVGLIKGITEDFPEIEIVDGTQLQSQGAFSRETNTIYLARDFLEVNKNNIQTIASVLSEELGHYIDGQLNKYDSQGDEGKLFALLVAGVDLTPTEIQRIKAENDFKKITLGDKTLQVEQSTNDIFGTTGRDYLVGTSQSDRITGGLAADIIFGDGGSDTFVYENIRDAGDTIKDFELRTDVIDLTGVLSTFRYEGLNPIADGYIQFSPYSRGTIVLLDVDGAGRLTARPYINVENVTPDELSSFPGHFLPAQVVQLPDITAALANDTGVSNSDRITLDPTVSGQATDATSLQGNLNGNGFVDISDALNPDGSFTISLEQYEVLSNGQMPSGDYALELKAGNSAGQESAISTVSFTLDRNAPPLSFTLAPESDTGEVGDNTTTEYTVKLVGQTDPGLEVILVETQQTLIADENGNFTFTDVSMPSAGKAPFTMVVVDEAGNQGRAQQFLTREGINGAPEITSTPELVFDTETEETYTYQVEATDPDGDDLTYTLIDEPLGAEIDGEGLISFTALAELKPSYDFTVEVSDGRGGTDVQTFTVEVPALANLGTIRGLKWEDLNGNGVRDNQLVQGANPDIVYVVDVSGSADFNFVGSPIGDFNGDGLENTRLDAEIAAFIALNEQLNNQGLGNNAQVGIVVYSGFTANADMDLSTDGLQLTTTLGADSNSDGTTDVEEILRSIRSGAFGVGNNTGTNPEAALRKVEETFAAIGTEEGTGNVIFLTDGEQNRGGSIADEVERLEAQGFNLSAFGVGDDASLRIIQAIDPDGIKFTSIDDILNAFGGIGEGSVSVLEPGLAGVSIYLDSNNNGVLDDGEPVQITAEDDPSTPDVNETGLYEFNNLVPGTYIVREVVPEGFEQTFPLRDATPSGDGYADIILEFLSGGNAPSPLIEPYGSTGGIPPSSPFNANGIYTVEPVNPEVILGAPPPSPIIGRNPEVDWLALPQGSYVTVGFTDEVVIDGPGDDIFIRSFDPQDSANEFADVFVSSNGVDFEFLGTVNERGLVSLDLADIGFTQPVTAVRVQGLDNRGTSPGFDLIGVEVLPGSIASPDFYTVEVEAGEVVENIDFGNVQFAINQAPVITSTPIVEAVLGQPYQYPVRANDPDGDRLTFNLNQAPNGMVIDPETGLISYTPSITDITLNFDTSDSQIRPGIDNQSTFTDDNQGLNFPATINSYAIGEGFNTSSNRPLGPVFRSAVTFDVSSLTSPVTSAKLQLQKNGTSGDPIETLGLFEVTTDTNTLYTSSYISPTIYEDLGTGTSFGTFDVATGGNSNEILEFELNQAAIAAINDAGGDFFSIGLALLSANPDNTTEAAEYLFAFSNNAGVQRLVLETENSEEVVEIVVSDSKGGEVTQNYTLSIVESSNNQAPVITSIPEINITLGETYEYQLEATDPDGDVLTYTIINPPVGMEVDDSGKITWNPTEIGEFTFEVAVSDGRGGVDIQVLNLQVLNDFPKDTEAPQVNLGFRSTVFALGDTLDLQIQGFDNVGLADLDLSFNDNSLTLTPDTVTNGFINSASVTLGNVGVFDVVATATDLAGNIDTETISVRVINPDDKQAPTIELDLSGFDPLNPTINERTNITGTVNDAELEFYRVELAPISLIDLSNPAAKDPDYITIAKGSGNVDNGVLAQIDPNLYRNDNYYLRVYTRDFSGNVNVEGVVLGINSQNKPGEFSLDFTDLSIPLTGIPIEVTRSYSSLDANFQGDFGFGWDLGLQDAQIVEAAPNGTDLSFDNFFGGNSFTVGTRVMLNTPDGRRVGFTFDPQIDGAGFFGARYAPYFRPDPGVYETLEVPDFPLSVKSDGSVGLYLFGFTYNPSDYILTTKDGTKYNYNQYQGLQTVEDQNSNILTFADDGITSSTGAEIDFIRDAQGRITQIVDPEDNSLVYTYDANGDLVTVKDRAGNETIFKYEAEREHYLTEIIDPLDRLISRTEYDEEGRASRLIDINGNAVEIQYEPDNFLREITDELGNTSINEFDRFGNLVREIDPLGNVTLYTYDSSNNLTSQTDPLGRVTRFKYDDRGNLTLIVKPHGDDDRPEDYSTNYQYDEENNLIAIISPGDGGIFNTYDSRGNLLNTYDSTGGLIVEYKYDQFGRVIEETTPTGTFKTVYDDATNSIQITDSIGIEIFSTFDELERVITTTDSTGALIENTYDSEGRVIRTDYGNGDVVEYTYGFNNEWLTQSSTNGPTYERQFDNQDRLISMTVDGISVVENEYDLAGRVIKSTNALGNVISYTYDAAGRVTSISDSVGLVENREYDQASQLIRSTDGSGATTEYTYYPDGRVHTVKDSLGNITTYSYTPTSTTIENHLGEKIVENTTPEGLISSIVYADGTSSLFEYLGTTRNTEAQDQLTRLIMPGGRERVYEYDNFGRLSVSHDYSGENWEASYDSEGQLESITGPLNLTTSYTYDDEDRLSKVVHPDNLEYLYSYDKNGYLIEATLPTGITIINNYDNQGRLLKKTSSTGETLERQYDSRGAVAETTSEDSVTSFEYDIRGNFTAITQSYGGLIEYDYDLIGRVEFIRVQASPDSPVYVTQYGYDIAGNLISVIDPLGGNTIFDYDSAGRQTFRRLPNGIETLYNYDLVGQVENIVHLDTDGNTLISIEYIRDPGGEPTEVRYGDGSYVELTYDSAFRLERETYYNSVNQIMTDVEYIFDEAGRRTLLIEDGNQTTYEYSSGYWLEVVDGPGEADISYNYDADGRVVGIQNGREIYALDFDAFDRLDGIDLVNDINDVSYRYDADGRRIGRELLNGSQRILTAPLPGSRLDSPYLIVDESNELVMGYVYAGDEPLLRFDKNEPIYYLTDAYGSIVGLVDQNAQLVAQFLYDSYGNIIESEGANASLPSSVGGDFRFQGMWLEETDLYFVRARYYDPSTGLFLSRDPVQPDINTPESFNPYQFAYNNSWVYQDPSGEIAIPSYSQIKKFIALAAKDKLLETGGTVATEILENALTLTGLTIPVPDFNLDLVGKNFGHVWEGLVENVLGNLPIGKDQLYIEVAMNKGSGKPANNGRRFGEGGGRRGSTRDNSFPDFLVSYWEPLDLFSKGSVSPKHSFVQIEAKLQVRDAYSKWIRGNSPQFKTIQKHALNYQYVPTAFLFTAIGGGQTKQKKSYEQIIVTEFRRDTNGRGSMFVLSVIDFDPRRRK